MKKSNGRIQPGVAIVLALCALGFLFANSHGCFWGPGIHMRGPGEIWSVPWQLFGLSGLLQLALGVWVGVDAHKRGSNGYFWGLLVFFTSIIGLLVYLLWVTDALEKVAPHPAAEGAEARCPSCGEPVEPGYKVCPACAASLKCPACDKPIRGGWSVCPWCATELGGSLRSGD